MVDDDKLKRLRQLYRDAKGGQMHDPHFRAIAERQFQDGDRRKWPFADAATLLGGRIGRSQGSCRFRRARDRLVGVPMDLGVTNRAGARLGPRRCGHRAHRTL